MYCILTLQAQACFQMSRLHCVLHNNAKRYLIFTDLATCRAELRELSHQLLKWSLTTQTAMVKSFIVSLVAVGDRPNRNKHLLRDLFSSCTGASLGEGRLAQTIIILSSKL